MSDFTIEQEKLQEIIIGEVKNALNEQIEVGIDGVIYEIVSQKVEERLDGILKHGDNLERVVELVANTDLKQWIHVNLDDELLADCVKNGLIAQLSTLDREELLDILSAKPKVSVNNESRERILEIKRLAEIGKATEMAFEQNFCNIRFDSEHGNGFDYEHEFVCVEDLLAWARKKARDKCLL